MVELKVDKYYKWNNTKSERKENRKCRRNEDKRRTTDEDRENWEFETTAEREEYKDWSLDQKTEEE